MFQTVKLFNVGSSPHTRDKFARLFGCDACYRIIPAYAGQISVMMENRMICWDHPRIRGTNSSRTSSPLMILGSSPHTRDKFATTEGNTQAYRIIPAYAGQMLGSGLFMTSHWDHPRIRGTNHSVQLIRPDTGGSSPHTRDKF